MELFSLKGRVALVTGASRGIGRAIASTLGQQGAFVVGTATTQAGAEQISAYLKEAQVEGFGLALDVTDAAASQIALTQIEEKTTQPVTVLVNNAGITRDNLAMRMKDEEWDAVLDTNLKAAFRMSRLVMRPMMKARFGRIINITSVVGSAGNPGQANYAAAKAGLEGMSRSLALELGARNITVNCIAPGLIDTNMTRALPDEVRAQMVGKIALSRLGSPEDVAGAVAFLASPAGAYVTGATLHVNGGMYMS